MLHVRMYPIREIVKIILIKTTFQISLAFSFLLRLLTNSNVLQLKQTSIYHVSKDVNRSRQLTKLDGYKLIF